ncbi:bifunctional diguanylate cyclase/phosphodiesterase [Alteromonas lipotrueiana]|uniref:bifunctional diguanylate cyclase/phosphodiesterase n=1 Tax=Alteromonas lipotrueiana TaxID=2803815 RepID=UPI001C47DAFE|nr:EAL domain-containing protein [Alteromonas lipotrueiana]
MTHIYGDNDKLVFLDEDAQASESGLSEKFWNVLVVDDDEETHTITRLSLANLVVNKRQLNFLHAYSASQAREMLLHHGSQIAVILLDVVMETDDAGLVLVKYLRETLGLEEPRIVLRTGRLSNAPEQSTIIDYDINDYKIKTEFTRNQLITTIVASVRAYQHIITINQNRVGLRKIIDGSANLLEEHSIKEFCEGVVTQLASLLGLEAEGLVCAKAGSTIGKDLETVYILGAAGNFAPLISQPLTLLDDVLITDNIQRCLRQKQHIFDAGFSVLYLHKAGFEAAVYVNMTHDLSANDKQLLELFLSSISIGYENVHLFQQLRNAAFRDWLTRLPNRNEFINLLERPSSDSHTSRTVALIDISRFADINDGLGQDAGNALLVSVATRLCSFFDSSIDKARISSDIFGLVGLSSKISPQHINDLFESSYQALEHTIPLNVHIGLYELPSQKETGLEILKRTNIALNRAKKRHQDNFEYYAPEIEERTILRLSMIRQLRNDFADRKLQLWFQPQINLSTGNIIGVESLLRWPDGQGGFTSPAVFIPMAEYSGLIVDIGQWVLDESCRRIQSLTQAGYREVRVAVNISMPQFRDRLFVDKVKQALARFACIPSQLELEITESVVMDEPQIVIDALDSLKAHGVSIAIDDFGTGFSSMSYLQHLPLDRLKVDRSFVNDIQPGKTAVIAETIVSLGNKLGLSTIAEGVERVEQADYMKQLGCIEAQGYMYAKPMPFDALINHLAARQASTH